MILNTGTTTTGPRFPILYGRLLAISLALIGTIILLSTARWNPIPRVPIPKASYRSKPNLLDDVYNRTLGFEKIYAINLPHRTDRRDALTLAASYTNLSLTYISGVQNIDAKVLPPGGENLNLSAGGLGCWRAHVNIFRRMVEENVQSALILEDDADWSVDIKEQMWGFARGTQLLVQPMVGMGGNESFLDPSAPRPTRVDEMPVNINIGTWEEGLIETATTSPYGDLDRWDLLWVGHCGRSMPSMKTGTVPIGRVLIPEDETVPPLAHWGMETFDAEAIQEFPPLTRVISRAWGETCTTGYAVSLPGARRLLYELGVWQMTGLYDMQLRSFCQGHEGRDKPGKCLSPLPQLFGHHFPKGKTSAFSDVSTPGVGEEDGNIIGTAYTPNVRLSTRVNFPRFGEGRTDWIDSWE